MSNEAQGYEEPGSALTQPRVHIHARMMIAIRLIVPRTLKLGRVNLSRLLLTNQCPYRAIT